MADLIAMQDAEFHAALAADMQAEAEALAQAQAQAAAAAEVEVQAAEAGAAAAAAADALAATVSRRRAAAAALPPEPDAGPGVAAILVRMADGRRIRRRFFVDAPLRQVADWVAGHDTGGVPFVLGASFPMRRFGGAALEDNTVGSVAGQALLQLLEEEEEEGEGGGGGEMLGAS
jgi:hypothetical protein